MGEVEPLELLEVQLCNSVAPFILVDRLRPSMASSPARRKYVVNVSAMEGQFAGRRYKGAGHPHTNMAKAALNMLTRTSAEEMLSDDILMTAVDTGGSPTSDPTTRRSGWPRKASTHRSILSTGRHGCTTRLFRARPASICTGVS